MKRFSFSPGTRISLEGRNCRLAAQSTNGQWYVVDEATETLQVFDCGDLLKLYVAGKLVHLPAWDESPRAQPRPRTIISDRSPSEQARIHFRSKLLEEIDKRTAPGTRYRKIEIDGKQRTELSYHLEVVSKALGRKTPVSEATYHRWLAMLRRDGDYGDLGGDFSNRGRRGLDSDVKKVVVAEMAAAIEAAKDKKRIGGAPQVTMRALTSTVRQRLNGENLRRIRDADPSGLLRMPSRSTLYDIWNEFPAYDRAVAQHGQSRARMMFRGGRGHNRPEACLDLVEYDETKLPFFFFDEDTGVPLGRAWLNWYVDVTCHIPTGIYLGFEPPSDLSMASALRHACLPKTYVADEYPDIKNSYLCAGIPRVCTFDNGLAQHGKSIERIALELGGMTIQYATVRTPWFKARVEGMFAMLNRLLLQEMPGFVLAPRMDRFDYDPSKQGCIGLRHFLYIFHSWLIDVYCQSPQEPYRITPAQRWAEGTRVVPPDFVSRAKDLDVLFGIERSGVMDHRGVVYETLRYYSDELHGLRMRSGHRLKVRVKINPSDLSKVHVWDERHGCWICAEAIRRDYAQGLSLHRHELNLKFSRAQFATDDVGSLIEAEQSLRALISDALPMALSIRTNSQIARAVGVGTQHIFNSLGTDGRLGELSGPFEGKRLNPFHDQAKPNDSALAPSAAIAPVGNPDEGLLPKTRRRFAADHSLKR